VLDVSAPAGDFVVQSSDAPLLLATAGAGITTVLPIVELIARTQPQRTVIAAHADRTAQDHALRDTVLHMGRQIDDFTARTLVRNCRRRRHTALTNAWAEKPASNLSGVRWVSGQTQIRGRSPASACKVLPRPGKAAATRSPTRSGLRSEATQMDTSSS
jgi:ferredoxin-NADP reductase